MALLQQNGSYLVWNGYEVGFGSNGIPLTVGFYEIQGPALTLIPSSICSGKTYAIRVSPPDVNTVNPGLFLSTNGYGGFILRPPIEVNNEIITNGLVTFQAYSKDLIKSNVPFKGKLDTTYANFIYQPNSEYNLVGYPNPLPTQMNNCQNCGCTEGVCGPDGICHGTSVICPMNVPCGFNGGKCPGNCQSGFICQKINGFYQCTEDNTKGVNFWISIALIIFFGILFIILIIFTINAIQTTPPTQKDQYNIV